MALNGFKRGDSDGESDFDCIDDIDNHIIIVILIVIIIIIIIITFIIIIIIIITSLCSALNIQAYVVKQVEENGWYRKEDIGRGE